MINVRIRIVDSQADWLHAHNQLTMELVTKLATNPDATAIQVSIPNVGSARWEKRQ